MTLTQNAVYKDGNARSRWSVFYYRKGKWRRKRFKEDFTAALKFYTENVGITGLTLHSDNVSFPPPNHITHAEREKWEIVTRNVKVKGVRKRKKFKRKITVVYNKMEEYNRQGIWWCPHCVKLRRFKEVDTERGTEMCCPVCWVSSYICREHNPLAAIIEQHKPQQRTSSGSKRKRRRG